MALEGAGANTTVPARIAPGYLVVGLLVAGLSLSVPGAFSSSLYGWMPSAALILVTGSVWSLARGRDRMVVVIAIIASALMCATWLHAWRSGSGTSMSLGVFALIPGSIFRGRSRRWSSTPWPVVVSGLALATLIGAVSTIVSMWLAVEGHVVGWELVAARAIAGAAVLSIHIRSIRQWPAIASALAMAAGWGGLAGWGGW